MPRILMPIGDATEALDTFYAYYRLPEDGFDVVVAVPRQGSIIRRCTRFRQTPTFRGTSHRNGLGITCRPPSLSATSSRTISRPRSCASSSND